MICDPVGVADIAERLGVRRQTVAIWKHRGLMPDPDWQRLGGPLWEWKRIAEWAQNSGRL